MNKAQQLIGVCEGQQKYVKSIGHNAIYKDKKGDFIIINSAGEVIAREATLAEIERVARGGVSL